MQRTKLELEFIFRASPTILYQFLTEPNCLIRWFCDEIDIEDKTYSFIWEGFAEEAELVEAQEPKLVKFVWEDAEDDEFLAFHMSKSPVTDETILIITDFCDDDEVDDQRNLWDAQIKKLRTVTGS